MSEPLPPQPTPDQPAVVPRAAGQSKHPELAELLKWVYTRNPFYAISAALVLWGLWVSFGQQTAEQDSWLLMASLAGYTVLLAGTAVCLVRFLQVWDDARTVLLMVVLMFLATSVAFDHVLVVDPTRGITCFLIGLGSSVFISEVLLHLIRLRLPLLYRVPYHLLLALFFLYPLLVGQLLDRADPVQEPVMWALFGFSTAAGLVFLTLLPALRRGEDYVRDNGSPWPWPLYPWSLFAIFAIAVPGRALLMCWSLHSLRSGQYDRLVFGPYFLVPFGFALGVLLLEMGLVTRRSSVLRFALVVPLVLLGLALVGHNPSDPVYRLLRVLTVPLGRLSAFGKVQEAPDPVYDKFLEMFSARLGADPLFLTLVLAAGFYLYVAVRRVDFAPEGLSAALALMALVGPDTLRTGLLHPPQPAALLAAAVVQLVLGAWRMNLWYYLGGGACLAGALALAFPLGEPAPWIRAGVFVQLLVLVMLFLGAVFSDPHGMLLRRVGSAVVLGLGVAAMHAGVQLPSSAHVLYPLVLGILLAVYGQFLRDSFAVGTAAVLLSWWVFWFGWSGYREVRRSFRGLDYIVSGLSFFVVAVLVSLAKSGVLARWIAVRCNVPEWLRPTSLKSPPPAPERYEEAP